MVLKSKPLQLQTLKRVIVLQTAFLGDIVLTTSFLRALRELLPEAEICLVTTKIGVEILQPNPWKIQLLSFDKRGAEKGPRGLLKKIRELRSWHPDLVFSLHRSLRSTILATSLKAKVSVGFKEAAASFLFSRLASRKKALFEADKNFLLLQEIFSIGGFNKVPELLLSHDQETDAALLLSQLGANQEFVLLAASSVWATKRWPAERFGELAYMLFKQYGLRSVLIGGQDAEDKKVAETLCASFASLSNVEEKKFLPLDLTGKTKLGTLKAVIAKAKLVFSNDSAPLHIATAITVPVVAIFGPTTKSLGFFPHAEPENYIVVEKENLHCRPCGKHGHDRCPLGHFRCMLEIDVVEVIRAAKPWLGNVRA